MHPERTRADVPAGDRYRMMGRFRQQPCRRLPHEGMIVAAWISQSTPLDALIVLIVMVVMLELVVGLLTGGPRRAIRMLYFTILPPVAMLTYPRTRWLGAGMTLGLLLGAAAYLPAREALQPRVDHAEAAAQMRELARPALDPKLTPERSEATEVDEAGDVLRRQLEILITQLETALATMDTGPYEIPIGRGGPGRVSERLHRHIEAIEALDDALEQLDRDQAAMRTALDRFNDAPDDRRLHQTLDAAERMQASTINVHRTLDRAAAELDRLLAHGETLTELRRRLAFEVDDPALSRLQDEGHRTWIVTLQRHLYEKRSALHNASRALTLVRAYPLHHRIE